MQLSPQTIRQLCQKDRPLITPFTERTVHEQTGLSGGLSCAGYDVHLGDVKPVFNMRGLHAFNRSQSSNPYIIPPRTGVLGVTKERFCIPVNLCMHYYNKSTLARWFLNASATLAEPGWEGYLTLELSNDTDVPIELEPGQPIGQVVFMQLDQPSETPYAGKYQNQGAEPVQAKRETVPEPESLF